MRGIKFKAYIYDLTDENSHPLEIDIRAGKIWDVASINFKDRIIEIMDDDGGVWEYELNDEIALMQYTGMKDQTGREIYEGYIVKYFAIAPTSNPKDGDIGVVKLEDGSFRIKPLEKNYTFLFPNSNIKNPSGLWTVVGNIYENPNLEIK